MPGGVTADVKTYSMFINGEWVASKSGKTFPVYDPSIEEVIAHVPEAGAADVERAVAAAKSAFEEGPWSTSTAQERGRVLFRLADKIRQHLPELAELECRNTGKPIVEAEFDITDAATCRSEEHTSELQSPDHLVCRLLLEKKNELPQGIGPLSPSLPDRKERVRTVRSGKPARFRAQAAPLVCLQPGLHTRLVCVPTDVRCA